MSVLLERVSLKSCESVLCRVDLDISYLLYSRWHTPWKNGESVTSTLRRHLQTHEDWSKLVAKLKLRARDFQIENDEPFDQGHWIDLLVDFIVVDDQVYTHPRALL